jgi:hypothetical protein
MAKKSFKLEDVEFVASKIKLESTSTQTLLQELKSMLEEESADDPAEKVEYRIVGLYPNNQDGIPFEERAIIPVKIPAEYDHNLLPEGLVKAAAKHNESRRAKKQGKVFSVTDLLTKATKKNLSEEGIKVQCNGSVTLVSFDPQLAKEEV